MRGVQSARDLQLLSRASAQQEGVKKGEAPAFVGLLRKEEGWTGVGKEGVMRAQVACVHLKSHWPEGTKELARLGQGRGSDWVAMESCPKLASVVVSGSSGSAFLAGAVR